MTQVTPEQCMCKLPPVNPTGLCWECRKPRQAVTSKIVTFTAHYCSDYPEDAAAEIARLRALLELADEEQTKLAYKVAGLDHETFPQAPHITLMNDGRAMGGSDVCHTCQAHCVVIGDLEAEVKALKAASTDSDAIQLLKDWMKGCSNPPDWHWAWDLHIRTVNLLGRLTASSVKASADSTAQCSGLCQGHSSEASLSGWLPDANCPVHGIKATLLQNGRGDAP